MAHAWMESFNHHVRDLIQSVPVPLQTNTHGNHINKVQSGGRRAFAGFKWHELKGEKMQHLPHRSALLQQMNIDTFIKEKISWKPLKCRFSTLLWNLLLIICTARRGGGGGGGRSSVCTTANILCIECFYNSLCHTASLSAFWQKRGFHQKWSLAEFLKAAQQTERCLIIWQGSIKEIPQNTGLACYYNSIKTYTVNTTSVIQSATALAFGKGITHQSDKPGEFAGAPIQPSQIRL